MSGFECMYVCYYVAMTLNKIAFCIKTPEKDFPLLHQIALMSWISFRSTITVSKHESFVARAAVNIFFFLMQLPSICISLLTVSSICRLVSIHSGHPLMFSGYEPITLSFPFHTWPLMIFIKYECERCLKDTFINENYSFSQRKLENSLIHSHYTVEWWGMSCQTLSLSLSLLIVRLQ